MNGMHTVDHLPQPSSNVKNVRTFTLSMGEFYVTHKDQFCIALWLSMEPLMTI